MTASIERGRLLIVQGRFELAAQELRRAVAEDAQSPMAHAMLSTALRGLDQKDEALAEAGAAVALAPDWAFTHYVRAKALEACDRLEEAKAAVCEAIRLEPEDADFHVLHGWFLFRHSRWSAALAAAETGLANDPEHVDCANLRAMALTKLGRRDESRAAVAGVMARDPENALSHAVEGWTSLEANRPRRALEQFRTALRIDPELDYARQGMVEALKARHFVYRVMLRYFLWMARLSGKAQWAVVIGAFVAYQLVRGTLRTSPGLVLLLVPLMVAYFVFCLLTWIAVPMFNLLLRLNRFGRYALSREETVASNWFGGFLAAALAALLLWPATGAEFLGMAALWFGLMLLPVSIALQAGTQAKRRLLCATGAGLGFLGAVACGIALFSDGSFTLFQVFILGWVLFPWLANFVNTR